MKLVLKDGTELTMVDGSYGAAFIFAITDLSEIKHYADKLTEDNLSAFTVEDIPYRNYVCDSGRWQNGLVIFEVRQKSEIELVKDYVDTSAIPDDEAADLPSLYDDWMVDVSYDAGDRCRRNGMVYKCIQAHTSQADWAPERVRTLWTPLGDIADEWPEWVQPLGAHDAYPRGAKVSHNGKHWTSDIESNVYEPPTQWTEV